MKYDKGKREMLSRRACSESGPHPDISVPSTSAGTSWGNGSSSSVCGHLWGKKNRGQTSAPVLELAGRMQPIILRTRRSWPVAPIHCRSNQYPGYSRLEKISKPISGMDDLMEPRKSEGTGKKTNNHQYNDKMFYVVLWKGKNPTTSIISEDVIDFDCENGPRAQWCRRWYDVDILAKDVDENKLKALEFTKEGNPLTTNEQESLKKAAKLRDQNFKNQNLRRDAKVLQQMTELKSSEKLNKVTRNEELESQTREKSILKDTKIPTKTKAELKRKIPVVSMEIAALNDDKISKIDEGSKETRTRAGKLKFKGNAEKKPTVKSKNFADKRTAKVKMTKCRADNPSDEKEEHVDDDVLEVNDNNKVHTYDNEEAKGSGVDEETEIREDSNTQDEAIGDAEKAKTDNQPVLAAHCEKKDGNLKNRLIKAKEMDESEMNGSCKSNKLTENPAEDSRKDISREGKKRITSIENLSGHPEKGTSEGGKMRKKSADNLLGNREDVRKRKMPTKSNENPCEDTRGCTLKERVEQMSSKGPGSESSPEDEPKMVELQKGSGIFVDYLELTDIKAFAKFPGRMACALLRLCLGNQLIEMNAKRGNKIPDNIYKAVYRTCCKKFGKRRQSKAAYRKTVADLCNKTRKRYRESKLKEADESETTDDESVSDGDISADEDSVRNFGENNDEGKIEKTTGQDEDTESYEDMKIDVTKKKAAGGVEDQKLDEVCELPDKGQNSSAGENLVPITSNSEGMGRVEAHDTKEENPTKCQKETANQNEADVLVVADEEQLKEDPGSRSNLRDKQKNEVEKYVNKIKDRERSRERKIKYDRYTGRDRERRCTHGDERFDRKRIDDKDREKPRRVRSEEKKDKNEDERHRHAHKHGHESCEKKRKDDRDKEKSRREKTKEKGDKKGNERQRRAHMHRDEKGERKRKDERGREKSQSERSGEKRDKDGNERQRHSHRHRDESAERKRRDDRDREKSRSERSRETGENNGNERQRRAHGHKDESGERKRKDDKDREKSQSGRFREKGDNDENEKREWAERNKSCNRNGIDQMKNYDKWRRNQENRYTKRKRDESCFENKDRDRDIRYRRNLDEDGIKSKKYLKKHSENEHRNKSHEKSKA